MADKNKKLDNIRHSLAHLLAAAVLKRWPEAKLGIGPTIENGFYYDILFPGDNGPEQEDLKGLEKEMRKMIEEELPFSGKKVSSKEAKEIFEAQKFKLDLIDEFSQEDKNLTVYKTGDIFTDLCRGGHVKNTKEINPKAFKLTKMAGAYWRGDEDNEMLTRIYGIAFDTKEKLDKYLKKQEEAKKRDHRKLGKELDLFLTSELVGSGLPLWTPKGTLVRNLLDDYVWELRKQYGYEKVEIPHITKKELYETSGHWEKFKEELFKIKSRDDHLFALKPMNCPHHTQIFDRERWSYRDLPKKYANTTMCYRDEQSGEIHGISRLRSFTQDDAHVFCRRSQIKKEMNIIWDIIDEFYNTFGFDLEVRLSLHDPDQPDKYLGKEENWEIAENMIKEIAKERGVDAPEQIGEAAFYGPKIDFIAKDSLGREWQVGTNQLDMNLPERFDLNYINEDGDKERVYMIHAAIMGSIERFMSILIEHLAGNFPTWLSPVQVNILPISEDQLDYGEKVQKALEEKDIRVEIPSVDESLGKRIRNFEKRRVPYALIVGDNEKESKTVSVRNRKDGDIGEKGLEEFVENISTEIKERK